MKSGMRLAFSLAVYVIWIAITVGGGNWLANGQTVSLRETVSHSVSWNIVAAAVFLVLVVALAKWKDLKFVAPRPWSTLRIFWFPSLYIVGFLVAAVSFGLPPFSVMAFILLNTLIVGFSEEAMFRGVLFQALRGPLRLWPAIAVTCLLFGAVHVLNVFITGQLFESAVQALTAALSGFVFIALLFRTGSLWPPIIYHGLWDFGTFVLSSSGGQTAEGPPPAGMLYLVPLAFVLPNVLYAAYLMRNVRNGSRMTTDNEPPLVSKPNST